MALQPVLIISLGYSYYQAALLPVLHCLLCAVFQPVFGYLSDRKGLRISLSISLLLSGCGVALLGMVPDHYHIMLACVALSALGHASFHIGAFHKVHSLSNEGDRGRLTSWFIVGGCIGQGLGPILCGLLITAGGFPALSMLVIPVLLSCMVLLILPVPDSVTVGSAASVTTMCDRKSVALLVSGATLRYWVMLGSLNFIPTFLVSTGYSLIDATTLVSIMIMSGVAGQLAGGFLSDAIGKKPVVVITTLAAIAPFCAAFFMHGILLTFVIILYGFLLWSSYSVSITLAHELEPANIGLMSGLMVGLATGIGSIGVALSGIIADTYGLVPCMITFAVVLFVAGIFFQGVPSAGKR